MARTETSIENTDVITDATLSVGLSSIKIPHSPKIAPMSKIFCDPVHGHISLHPICVAIIDTPEFQRLRNIKQTGLLEYVYPGATHNRFGHSLGVCYLAGKFIRQLHERQPELGITPTDILCVEIAGLCHDLGHGPLSHLWEIFINAYNECINWSKPWQHEKVSQNLFDHLLHNNQLLPELKKFGIGHAELKFIKKLIGGHKPENGEKAFIYQIVNNEDSGLDVDKWDYFLRDCHYLGLACSFEYKRLMKFACVLTVDGRKQICFRDKVLEGIYNVFRTRGNLHKSAYQHRVVKLLDIMFCDAMLEADGKVTGPSGEKLFFWQWSMSAAFGEGDILRDALQKYCMLTDNLLFSALQYSSLPKVVGLISALEKRSCKCCGIYSHVDYKICPFVINKQEVFDGIRKLLPSVNDKVLCRMSNTGDVKMTEAETENFQAVEMSDIHIEVLSINWGKREKNPVQFVPFYSKGVLSVGCQNREDPSILIPKVFEEIQVHVICRRSDVYAVQVVKKCFNKFWKEILASPL